MATQVTEAVANDSIIEAHEEDKTILGEGLSVHNCTLGGTITPEPGSADLDKLPRREIHCHSRPPALAGGVHPR